MSKSKIAIHINPFEPRPIRSPTGDSDPRAICFEIGSALGSWEMAEVAYSYLFNNLVRPQITSPALRRAYGAVISPRGRRGMIRAAADIFFHNFPDATLENELDEFLNIYDSAASRRNDVAHGVIFSALKPYTGWYLEANSYSNKRNVKRESPYAYTSSQIKKFSNQFSRLGMDVNAFRDTLKEHFLSCDPKLRERY